MASAADETSGFALMTALREKYSFIIVDGKNLSGPFSFCLHAIRLEQKLKLSHF